MKRLTWTLALLIAASVATAFAQPPGGGPGGPGGPGPRGGQGGGGGNGGPGMRPLPIVEVLDADHDHVISADELKNATASLLTLDKNSDGKLTPNEFGPQGGPQGAGRGQGGPAAGGKTGPTTGRNQGGPNGPGGKVPAGGPGGGGPESGPPRPNPELMVEHMMQFDANKDGKLSREEAMKFAQDFVTNHPGPGGPGGGGNGGADSGPNDGERPERPQRPE